MTDTVPNIRQRREERLRPRRKSKWLRWLAAIAIILLIGGGWFYRSMTRPAKLRRIAQEYLQAFFTSDLTIDRVRFSLLGGIELEGVTLSDPCAEPGSEPLATCREMILHHQPLQLLLGRLRFDAIHVSGARGRAVFDDATGHFNVQEMLARNQLGDMAASNLPRISTGDIEVDMVRRSLKTESSSITESLVERLTLNILALPDPDGSPTYDVVWDATSDRFTSGTLRIDFDKMTISDVEGGTPWLSVRAAALATEAVTPGARYWMDLLGFEGKFQVVDFALPLIPAVDERHHISIKIEQGAISVPIDDLEMQLPSTHRYLTLTDVAGTLGVMHDGAVLEFSGVWQESQCTARLRLSGSIDENTRPGDIAFVLDLEAKQFTLPRTDAALAPAESRLIASLPKLAKFYRHYDPHGKVDLSLSISKGEGRGAPIVLDRAHIEAMGTDVSHHKFPYRVTDVRGTVEVGPEGVNVIGLSGKHGDGRVFANGWTAGPVGPMAADIEIYGYGIALDADLCSGLGPHHRVMWDSFDPQGVADIHVSMHRDPPEANVPAPWDITTVAQIESADATFAQFPYPIHDLQGRVTIDNNVITISDVKGRGYNSDVVVDGIARTTKKGLEHLDLHIVANQVDLDERLFSCFETQSREQIQRLRPEGTVNVEVVLSKKDLIAPIDYHVNVDLNGSSIRHANLQLPIQETEGRVQIGRTRIDVLNVTGQLAGGQIEFDGHLMRDAVEPSLDIRAKCRNMTLGKDVIASLPKNIQKPLQDWGISGTLNADTQWHRQSNDPTQSLDSTIQVNLTGVQIRHPQFPIPIEVVSGSALIHGSELTLTDVRASGDGIELNIDGTVNAKVADLKLDVTVHASNKTIRDTVPWRLRKLLGNLQPSGTLRLREGRLHMAQNTAQIKPDWNLTGILETDELSIQSGVSFENLQAQLPFKAGSNQGMITFTGNLAASQMTIAGLPIQDIEGIVNYDARQRQWSITELHAQLSRSALSGEARTWIDSGETHYGAAFSFDDVPLEELSLAFATEDAKANRKPIAGTVVGQVSLGGVISDPSRRRAGGTFRVREAELYKLPAMLAILNVINLTLPRESAFQEIDAEFYLSGDVLQFRNLHLKGNALAMVGEGDMTWSTKNLDLKLTAVSPKRGGRIPVVTELLEGASREVVEVRVTGTMDQPVATARPFRSVSNALDALLKPKKKSRKPR